MKKNITITLAAALLAVGANAQIGGGLLGKAKSKVEKAVETPKSSGNSSSTPSSSSPSSASKPASSSSSSKVEEKPAAKDYNIPTNDLKKVIGDNDLYYSAILAQGFESKIMVSKPVKEKSYMQEQWIPNAINVYQDAASGKIQFCYFALYDGMADPSSSFKIRDAEDAFRYKYKGIFWDSKSDYTVFENLMYNRYLSTYGGYPKHFVGMLKQADGSIVVFAMPEKKNDNADEQEYINYTELGYNPVANKFDYDALEVDILVKTEAGAKTADLATAKATVTGLVKKAMDEVDKKAKEDADKKIAGINRETRGMVNATYEKTMMTYLQANFKKEFKRPEYWENATIGNLIITSKDWGITKNDYGLIQYRSIACEVVIKNKGRCYVKSFVFAQDYAGGGNYSTNLYYNGFSSGLEQIKCEKVK